MIQCAIVFIFFMTSLVSGEVVSQAIESERLEDFSGGLNTQSAPSKIQKNESPDMQNVYVDERPGSIVQANGFTLAGSTNTLEKINFMALFKKEDGIKEYIISNSSRVLTTKDFQIFTNIRSNLNSTLNLQAIQVRNKMWFSNGSDAVFTYDGATVTVLDGQTYSGLTTPNVPKGKYLAFYQERVFAYNLSDNNSGLAFSALTSTDGIAIAPDDSRAWPSDQILNVGRGDGQVGTSLFVFNGNLYAHKERGIYLLYGTDEETYFLRKIVSDNGAISHDSVVSGDNLQYFIGENGIYALDGQNSIRISDKIAPDLIAVRKDVSRVVSNVWDTQTEFNRGDFSATTSNPAGFVSIFTEKRRLNFIDQSSNPTNSSIFKFSIGLPTFTAFGTMISTITVEPGYIGKLVDPGISTLIFWERSLGGNPGPHVNPVFRNDRTGQEIRGTMVDIEAQNPSGWRRARATMTPPDITFTADDINNGKMLIKYERQDTGDGYEIFAATVTGNADITVVPNLAGQFISETTTITTLNAWGNFTAITETGGGSINFYIRTSSRVTDISTKTWTPISPGSVVGSSTSDKFIQWASTITSISTAAVTIIDRVAIEHIEGAGSDTRPIGTFWKNRYWLAVTTATTGDLYQIYVKAKNTNPAPTAWMKFIGINIKSFLQDGADVFYGGSASTGSVFRLDNGTNFNGSTITAFYETPDLDFGYQYWKKDLTKYYLDAKKETGGMFLFGTSLDGGLFSDVNIDTNGSGRLLKTVNDVNKTGKFFRFRFQNESLDKGMTINGLSILYRRTQKE